MEKDPLRKPIRWSPVWLAVGLSLALLAGCTEAPPPAEPGTDGTYGCTSCLLPADNDPTRGHFENFLAVSPAADGHFVVAACTFDGERFQVTAHVSFDQGRTWAVSELPYGERVPIDHPLRTINFAADPGVAISPDGKTVVVAAVGLTTVPIEEPNGNLPLQSIMFVARSDDGGLTFPPEGVHVLQGGPQPYPAVQDFSDHPRIVTGADGTFLVMWGSLDLPSPGAAARFLQTQDVNLATSLEVRFSSSIDGKSWSESALAYKDTDLLYYPPSPIILHDGTWAVMPNEYNGGDGDVYFSRSEDRGATWTWEATPMKVRGGFGTAAASRVDDRLFYSYNAAPEAGVDGVWPMLAVSEGPGQPWTVHALTDQPTLKRIGIENMVAVDGRGVAHVLYTWKPAGATTAEVRATSVHLDGSLTHTTLEANVTTDRSFGHYVGFDAMSAGAVGTWPVATIAAGRIWEADKPLVVGIVEWQP